MFKLVSSYFVIEELVFAGTECLSLIEVDADVDV